MIVRPFIALFMGILVLVLLFSDPQFETEAAQWFNNL